MNAVKFSLFLPTRDFAKARAAAEWADTHGFYSVSINDHFFSPLGPPQTPQLECFSTLSAIAAVTKNVRLAPAVTAMSFRHPPMLAKIASTLDHLSNGRLVLGLGAGWQRSEYEAHGYPYPSNAERCEQLGEAIKLIKAMWTQDEPTYRGRYFSAACNAPVLLVGTPEEVRRELRSRIEEFGMTYYIVFPTSEESRNLLVSEIMPEFTLQGGGQ